MILRAVTVRGVKSVEQSQENFTEFAYSKSMTISLVWLCKTREEKNMRLFLVSCDCTHSKPFIIK